MSHETDALVEMIRKAFGRTPHPGDPFLQGSHDGCEPYDEIAHFKGKPDWTALDPDFLDARYCALSFFSEGAFRFYLPAYLVADVRRLLRTADPAFHLTHGFSDSTVAHRSGGTRLLNPRRYGAMTWEDYARYRLSVFSREEAVAIVAYLRWRREPETMIDAALTRFWEERARSAPLAGELADENGTVTPY
jgi:hypothetical protein